MSVQYGVPFTLEGPDGTKAVFNNEGSADYVGILSPESSGLDSPEVREDALSRVENDGGVHGNFFYDRRPVVLQGTIIASSATQRNERVEKLQRASNALRGNCTLKWTPTGGTERMLELRRQQPLRVTGGYVKEFMLPLVSADAFIVSATQLEKTGGVEGKQEKTSAGTVAEDTSVGTSTWTNPTNAQGAINATYATASTLNGATTHYLKATNFGFTVPAGATILGVYWGFRRKSSSAAEPYFLNGTRMFNAGGAVGKTLSGGPNWTTVIEDQKFGSTTGILEFTPSQAEVNASTFGCAISAKNTTGGTVTGEVDAFNMAVYYAPAAVEFTVENKGNAEALPTLNLAGVVKGTYTINIENVTTGRKLQLDLNLTTPAETATLAIDFKNRTISFGTENGYKYINLSNSEWWGVVPGTNTIKISAGFTYAFRHRHTWV